MLAEANLDKALETYLKGFEADWRDAYPGVNAVTLLELKGNGEDIAKLAPVVEYAVNRKIATKTPDYWDYATLIELAVIQNDEKKAEANFRKALSCPIEGSWLFDTTLKNLQLIVTYRKKRNEDFKLAEKVASWLQQQADLKNK